MEITTKWMVDNIDKVLDRFKNECIPSWQDYDQLRRDILSPKTVISIEDYERYVLGINKEKEVSYMASMCRNDYDMEENRDIHFLFEKEKCNCTKIENMESSHIINTLLMLNRRAMNYKLNYELFVIDHSKDNLLVPKDNIYELAKINPSDWICTTPIYVSLVKELDSRGLLNYYNTVKERIALAEKEKGE